MNYPRSNNIFSEKLEQNKIFNQTHVIDNDSIKSKIGIKKYSSNDNLQNIYNISCNEYNSNYNIFKDNNTDIFNNTCDKITNRNNRIISGEKFDTDKKENEYKINSKNVFKTKAFEN